MRKAIVLAIVAVAVAYSDRTEQPTGPSMIPSSSPSSPSSRVVVSGTVFAAESGSPIPRVRVEVVQGVNTGRSTFSDDGHYQLADLEPGTLALQFSTAEY